MVKLLLERGAQVDLQNNYGQSSLIFASDNGQTEVVKLLIERGPGEFLIEIDERLVAVAKGLVDTMPLSG